MYKKLKTTSKIAIIDIDDTIADFKGPAMEILNEKFQKNIHWKNWHTYNLSALYGVTREQFVKALYDSNILDNIIPYDGSVEILNRLRDDGYYIHFLTSRGWYKEALQKTVRWAMSHGLLFDCVTVITHNESKDRVAKLSHGKKIDLAVDDCAAHINSYLNGNNVLKTVQFKQPWNADLVTDHMIENIKELEKHI